MDTPSDQRDAASVFIERWRSADASELSTSQSFLIELCHLLGVATPHATADRDYMFERPIAFAHGDGSSSPGRIDLYRRGAFVLEAKKLRQAAHTRGFDDAMLRARSQAEAYARALPADEGRPPFVLVVDVGRRIELYAEFSRSGATYTPFPDPRSHRIALDDLRREDIRERLRCVWDDPLSLDPSRESARVTREIAARLAELAKSLERVGHAPEAVAQFLMRCLFTMFAEDVRLLPAASFADLIHRHRETPDIAMRMLGQLWRDMDAGGFSAVLAGNVLRFNGKLFKQPDVLPLDRQQLDLLAQAARADWRHVEPAIFGTLLERALSPSERHKLGAHYTPRAYVERLVLPTVIEPLRSEWEDVKAAVLVQIAEAHEARERGIGSEGKRSHSQRMQQYHVELGRARDLIRDFHQRLCRVRVLDPACGSGNFLYVTLEHLKRLEGEVLNALEDFGLSRLGVSEQTDLDVAAERAISLEAETVDPHNLLGIEINPRAAAIAEVVLWIGYLQWHFRTRGDVQPPQPVIRDFRNIECRDAVLAYDSVEFVTDERGIPVTYWDGRTMKLSPVTTEPVPDESARVPLERYLNPRRAEWPAADFVVGNPPFIGNKRMRIALGDGYVEALRGVWTDVPDTSDFVMYWWQHAARLTRRGGLQRFGLITTNSITQSFNRRVIEAALSAKLEATAPSTRRKPKLSGESSTGPDSNLRDEKAEQPLSLAFAIPDHPWVDSTDGAAVRIAMTVAGAGLADVGRLLKVTREDEPQDGEVPVLLAASRGVIHADLSVGAKVVSAVKLLANANLCFQGMNLVGKGFRVEAHEVVAMGYDLANLPAVLKPHCNARDLMQAGEHCLVIDFFGLSAEQARESHPALFQRLLDRVKPERDLNNRASRRINWWLFGEPVGKLRRAWDSLERVILTPETAKHRVFVYQSRPFCPDHKLYAICLDEAGWLGVLSSSVHKVWALSAGGRLGVGNDPTWTNTTCFAPFPFPSATEVQLGRARELAERLDSHRKRQQSIYSELTLTGMYNVLDKLRSGEPLSAKERVIHEHGLVSVLRQIHDDLDAAVLDAYGWSDLLPLLNVAHGNVPAHAAGYSGTGDDAKRAFEEAILERLVTLNAERAAEEARGLVRWLRPEFQSPSAEVEPQQDEIDATSDNEVAQIRPPVVAGKPQPWPKDTIAQVRAVADVLAASPLPLSVEAIAARFTGRGPWKKRLPQLLDMLVALGRARSTDSGFAAQ